MIEQAKDRTTAILELIPKLCWIGFAMVVFFLFYPQIKNDILPNISSIKIAGVEATLKSDFAELRKDNKDEFLKNYISPKQEELIVTRSRQLSKILPHSKILWFDNHQENNKGIRSILKKWGVTIDCTETSEEANRCLKNAMTDSNFYDLIISNNNRPGDVSGLDYADSVNHRYPDLDIPFILFSGSYARDSILMRKGVPKTIFAATNRYDYLFHFIFDVLERGNAPYPANIQRAVYSEDSAAYYQRLFLLPLNPKSHADTLTRAELLDNGNRHS